MVHRALRGRTASPPLCSSRRLPRRLQLEGQIPVVLGVETVIHDLDAGESRHAIGDRGPEPLAYVWGQDNLGPGGVVYVTELTLGAGTERRRAARRRPFARDRRG